MDALEIIHDNRVWFIVMGDGPKKYEFMAYAKKKQIQATFTGMLSYDKMCSLLNICDITVLLIRQPNLLSISMRTMPHLDFLS